MSTERFAKSCLVKENDGLLYPVTREVIHDDGYQFHAFYNIYDTNINAASREGFKMEYCYRNGGYNG